MITEPDPVKYTGSNIYTGDGRWELRILIFFMGMTACTWE